MSESSNSRGWAIGLWGLAVGLTAVTLVFLALNGRVENEVSIGSPVVDGLFNVLRLSFPAARGGRAPLRERGAAGGGQGDDAARAHLALAAPAVTTTGEGVPDRPAVPHLARDDRPRRR